jgi:PTH1 family peptidyl-tRNA hydrolase
MTKLVVGLGNLGTKYEKTRHNVGFFIVDRLASSHECRFSREKFQGIYCDFLLGTEKVVLLKPQTMMNLSGECVAPWMEFLKLDGRDVLVVHDELDLPLGRFRGQWAGSSGGNNGIQSILERLGHPDFCRLRVGVGRPPAKSQVVSYLLSPFDEEEWKQVGDVVQQAAQAAEIFVEKGLDPMMQVVNKRA